MAALDPVSKMLTPPDTPETDGRTAAIQPPPPTPQTPLAPQSSHQLQKEMEAEDQAPQQPAPEQQQAQDAPSTPEDDIEIVPRDPEPPIPRRSSRRPHQPPTNTDAPPSSTGAIRRGKTQTHRRARAAVDTRKRQSQLYEGTDSALDHFDTQSSPLSHRHVIDTSLNKTLPAGRQSGVWDLALPDPYSSEPGWDGAAGAVVPYKAPARKQRDLSGRRGSVSRALRVKMNLNLEVEISLKARIRGELLLTVL